MKRRLYRDSNFRRAQNIEELREIAKRRTPNFSFEYVEGRAEDEVTLTRNRTVFEEIALLPRTLVDVAERRQQIHLFGKPSALPFLIGSTGFNGLLTHQGDLLLARAAAKVGDKLPGLIDSGFRRGSDIVKALMLGADAVLLGRATLYGLAAGGEAGTAHAIEILRTEIDHVLGLLGCPDITTLDARCVRWPGRAITLG